MSREKFVTPAKCVGCRRLSAWDRRLDGISEGIKNAPEATAEVFGTPDMEAYMAKVDAEEGYYLHQYEVAKTCIQYLISHCVGLTIRRDVFDVSDFDEVVDPLIVDIPVCGIPDTEWEELDRILLYLPLEGEDE